MKSAVRTVAVVLVVLLCLSAGVVLTGGTVRAGTVASNIALVARGPAPSSTIRLALSRAPGTWTNRLAFPTARAMHSMVYDATAHRDVLFGGISAAGPLNDTWTYDRNANAWTNVTSSGSPSARYGSAMADLSSEGRVLLFGGFTYLGPQFIYSNETWTFDEANSTWTSSNASFAPWGRWGAVLVYDRIADRAILYGGFGCEPIGGCGALGDTWAYNPRTNNWTNRNAIGPFLGQGVTMVYDSRADQTVLFGGLNAFGNPTNETWVYNYTANTWTRRTPPTSPPALAFAGMAYDPSSDRVILFGGGATELSGATWMYNVAVDQWTNLAPTAFPAARSELSLTFDGVAGRVLLDGGTLATSGHAETSDQWMYDPAANRWDRMSPSFAPLAVNAASMAYDSAIDRLVLFGGYMQVGGGTSDLTWTYDRGTDTWLNMKPAAHPSSRGFAAMVYDSKVDRIVLYGGSGPSYLNDTWTYDLRNNTWIDRTSTANPGPRFMHAMVYDPKAARAILFGGSSGSNALNDTWAYDFSNDTWVLRPVTGPAPSPRYAAGLSYDATADRIVLFGGGSGIPGTSNQTWALDYANSSWQQRAPPVSPSARGRFSLAFDASAGRTILFGGSGIGGTAADMGDTWSYDYAADRWTNRQPAPHPSSRSLYAIAYDSAADRTMIFGAGNGGGLVETWAYAYAANAWTLLNAGAWPLARFGHVEVYDSESDAVVLFGGSTRSNLDSETWVYSSASNAWKVMQPGAIQPDARALSAAAYDPTVDRTILFGGTTGQNYGNDTWAYDVNTNTWTNRSPLVHPPNLYVPSISYDARTDRIILFGGIDYGRTPARISNATWVYDYVANTWANVTSVIHPPAPFGPVMTYDIESNRLTQFGGSDGGLVIVNDTWTFDAATNSWSNVSTPPSPRPRYLSGAVYDAKVDRMLLFGGIGDPRGGQLANDTWAYDDNTNSWTNVTPERPPSARLAPSYAFDSKRNLTLMFGGYVMPPGGAPPYEDDGTWTYRSPDTVPTAPRGDTATRTPFSIGLQWQVPFSDGGLPIGTYRVYRGTVPGGETFLAAAGNVTSFADSAIAYGATYYYVIRAVNAAGEGTPSTEVAVPPLALHANALANPVSGPAPLTVTFNASASGGSPPYAFRWDFGDGFQSTLHNVSHTYSAVGTFQATVTIMDAQNRAANQTILIAVQTPSTGPPPPTGGSLWFPIAFLIVLIAAAVMGILFWRRSRGRKPPVP